jgi:hypothetical protein
MSQYLFSDPNPVSLRFRVWVLLSLQFVSRGLEFHEQLRVNSIVFLRNENGMEYATLSHETKKNWQGGLESSETPKEKRMYAIPGAGFMCPVASLKQFIYKTQPDASSLFNCCSKSALKDPTEDICYTSTLGN